MPGEQAGAALKTDGWYLITRGGDLVLRIWPGMQLGEDTEGELTFETADAQVRFDVADDNGLVLLAQPEHELEMASGNRVRSLDLSAESPVYIRLTHNALSIATDFVEALPREALQVRVAPSVILMPEPGTIGSPSRSARRRNRQATFATLAVASTIAMILSYSIYRSQLEPPPGAVTSESTQAAIEQPPALPEPTDGRPRIAGPATDEAIRHDARQPPRVYPHVTLRVPEAVPATAVEAPEAPSIEPVLAPTIPHRTITGRLADRLADRLAGSPAAALPDAPPESLAAAAETTAPADAAAPTEFAVLDAEDADLEQIGRAVRSVAVDIANERDLRAAADALERGMLVKPPEFSAFALYSRVLESEPDSPAARIGIQSIQDRLLARARTSLASDDVGATLALLDDAAIAGADRAILDDLRATATYRQQLLDAKAGLPGSLYPITELIAIRQDTPEYPRHAPAGAEGSVEIEMTVTDSGQVRDVEVLGDPPMYFLRAAKRSVSEWRFMPVLDDGKPVPVRTAVRVTFQPD